MTEARERFLAFRQSVGRPPRLTRHTVRARGLDFAVYSTPPVSHTPPLCCVNGGMLFDHKILWPALAPLAATRQLILYDQRGRGHTPPPPGARAARIEHDAGDLPALRLALGIERWDVLGHSWGGGIAMLGVAQDQDATGRLVLVDPVGATSDWLPGLHAAGVARLLGVQPEAAARLAALDPALLHHPDPAIHTEYARAFYPAWFADQTLAAMFAPPRSASVTGAAVAARLRHHGYDWRDTLRAIRVPSLVVHGAADVLPPELSQHTVRLLANSTLRLLPDAGHMPFWEAPREFFAVVEQFLAPPTDTSSQTRSPPG